VKVDQHFFRAYKLYVDLHVHTSTRMYILYLVCWFIK